MEKTQSAKRKTIDLQQANWQTVSLRSAPVEFEHLFVNTPLRLDGQKIGDCCNCSYSQLLQYIPEQFYFYCSNKMLHNHTTRLNQSREFLDLWCFVICILFSDKNVLLYDWSTKVLNNLLFGKNSVTKILQNLIIMLLNFFSSKNIEVPKSNSL